MRKKLQEARASALNGVTAKLGGNIFVLAAAIEKNVGVYEPKAELSAHKCSECNAGFAALADTSPFCPNCGSGETNASEEQTQVLPVTDESLSSVNCPECAMANILHDATATLLDGHMHCVTCGIEISYEVEADGEGSKPVVMEQRDPDGKIAIGDDSKHGDAPASKIEERVDTKQPQVNKPVLSKEKQTADEKGVKLPTETGDQDRPIKDADAADIKTAIEGDKLKPIPSVQNANEQILDDPVVEELDDEDLQQAAADDDQSSDDQQEEAAGEPFGGKKAPPFGKDDGNKKGDDGDGDGKKNEADSAVEISILSTLRGDKALSLASSGDKLMAFVNDKHVATLTAEKAGANSKIMHSATFAKALTVEANKLGLKDAFASLNFDLVKVTIPVKAIVTAKVAKRVKVETARLEAEAADYSEKFMQCMSIAAAGLNKGFFAKEENSIKRGMFENLSSAGMKNAEKLIDQVFAKYGDTYHKTLLTIAASLMEKPAEVRNSMAEAVAGTSYMPVTAEEDTDQDDSTDEQDATILTARLESASIVGSKPRKAVVASSVRDLVPAGSFFQRS